MYKFIQLFKMDNVSELDAIGEYVWTANTGKHLTLDR